MEDKFFIQIKKEKCILLIFIKQTVRLNYKNWYFRLRERWQMKQSLQISVLSTKSRVTKNEKDPPIWVFFVQTIHNRPRCGAG